MVKTSAHMFNLAGISLPLFMSIDLITKSSGANSASVYYAILIRDFYNGVRVSAGAILHVLND